MVIYFEYETTAPTYNWPNPEQKETFVVSYVMIVAFHPDLRLNRILVERSSGHSFQKLITTDYLTEEQMAFVDVKVIKQLKDAVEHVSKGNCKKSLGQMFSIELYLIKYTLMTGFNRKIKSQHLQLDILQKITTRKKYLINWATDKCCLCKFPLNVDLTNPKVPNNEMSCGDFYIMCERKFSRNICSNEQLKTSPQISTLANYYKTYQKIF